MDKKRELMVRGKRIFVGLEDSKRTWKVCVRRGGEIVHETSLPAEYPVLRSYLVGRYPDCEMAVIYEAGFRGFWLHDLLVADGIKCVVTPPHLVTQAKVNRVKTDRVDARRLAKILESGDYRACYVPDAEWREDRQVARTLLQVRKDLTRTKNRVRKLLDFHGVAEHLPAGRWYERQYQEVAGLSVSTPLQGCLEVHLDLKAALQEQYRDLTKQLRHISRKPRWARLVALKQSCPGIGWLTAVRLTLEWGELERFERGDQLAAFAGLTASEYSSGPYVRRGHITGQGSGPVRGWLIECAWRAIKRDPVLQEKFSRVWSHSGSKKKGIVATARKLVVRLWAVETSGRPYQVGLVR